jgi:hypothetical protein
MGERDAMIEFLQEQIHDLNIEFEDANEHIEMHHAQQAAQHAPPDEMDAVGDDEPQEMESVSKIDYEVGTHCHHHRELTPPCAASRSSTTSTTSR